MTPTEFEQYCFLRLYSIDMDTAIQSVAALKRYKKSDIQVIILRDIAVTYARPFSGNYGIEISTHYLKLKHVPSEYKGLHDDLISLRKTQLAHTDLSFHKPKVSRLKTNIRNIYPMTFKPFNYNRLLSQIADIELLIKKVAESINSEIQHFESRF